MTNKKLILFFVFIIFLVSALIFFPHLKGIIANSDSFWGINATDFLKHSFYVWDDRLYGGVYFASPFMFGYALAALLNFFQLSFSNTGVIFSVLLGLLLITYKILTLVLKEETKKIKLITFLISTFVITNDMLRVFLITNITIIWGIFFMLLTIYFYLRYFLGNKFVFVFMSAVSLCFSFIDFHSGVLAGIYIFLFSFIYIMSNLSSNKTLSKIHIRKFLTFALLVILFNAYWLTNNIYDQFSKSGALSDYVKNTTNTKTILQAYDSYNNLAANLVLTNKNSLNDPFGKGFIYYIDLGISFVFVFLASFSLWYLRKKTENSITAFAVLMVIFMSLAFGPSNPFGLFTYLWQNIPGFMLFRDFYKFHRLLMISYLVLSTYTISNIIENSGRYRKGTYYALLFLMSIFTVIKFFYLSRFSFNFHPFVPPNYYKEFKNFLGNKKIETHLLVMPILSTHQWFEWPDKPHYDIQDPIRYFSPLPLYVNNASFIDTFGDLTNKKLVLDLGNGNIDSFIDTASVMNIKYFVIRQDHNLDFIKGKASTTKSNFEFLDTEQLIKNTKKSGSIKKVAKFDKLRLFSIDSNRFFPLFSLSTEAVMLKNTKEGKQLYASMKIYESRLKTAAYFQNIIKEKVGSDPSELTKTQKIPVVEFKKIGPTLSRVIFHQAKGKFPIFFSETFHPQWKMEMTQLPERQPLKIDHYKILPGNIEEQADLNEINFFVKNNWLTYYSGQFVSKLMKNTIQNNNISSVNLFDLLSRKNKSVHDSNHFKANGYANAWILDTETLCINSSLCNKNPDGTYDFATVVYFYPQIIYQIGLAITFISILSTAVYTFISVQKPRNEN